MDMELGVISLDDWREYIGGFVRILDVDVRYLVHGVGKERTYNGYFSTKLILDFTLLVGIWTFFLDDGEELLDSHICGCGGSPGGWELWKALVLRGSEKVTRCREASATSR